MCNQWFTRVLHIQLDLSVRCSTYIITHIVGSCDGYEQKFSFHFIASLN